jgi:hypothetical protein
MRGRGILLCPICETKTPLFDLLALPTAAAESVAAQIGTDAKAGRQRMTAAFVIKAKEAQGKFDVFLSHNSKDKAAVEKIARRLLKVGIRPWLDKWNLPPGSRLSNALAEAIDTVPCAALFFGPADVGNWHIMEIDGYLEKWAGGNARMIPVILPALRKRLRSRFLSASQCGPICAIGKTSKTTGFTGWSAGFWGRLRVIHR